MIENEILYMGQKPSEMTKKALVKALNHAGRLYLNLVEEDVLKMQHAAHKFRELAGMK